VDKTTIISLEKGNYLLRFSMKEAVLGAMMIDKKRDDVIDILQPDAFTKTHTNIF
jgi:replicative DNA helicase